MSKDTVTIDRRVLEELINPHSRFRQSALDAAEEVLGATRPDEEIMRDGVAAHVRRYCNDEHVLKLVVIPRKERDSSGMLEWVLRYEFEEGGGITIGMIQRAPGAEVEYHS